MGTARSRGQCPTQAGANVALPRAIVGRQMRAHCGVSGGERVGRNGALAAAPRWNITPTQADGRVDDPIETCTLITTAANRQTMPDASSR